MFTLEPYSAKGARDTRNDADGIYQQSGGTTVLNIQLTEDGQAYTATIAIGVDLSAPVQSSQPGPGGPPPGGRPPPTTGQISSDG